MKQESTFTITMEKTGQMQFTTTFDKNFPDLIFDESERSGGQDEYPNASRILTASIANCLSASFTFCLLKSRVPLDNVKIKAVATTTSQRNEESRWRIPVVKVELFPIFEGENPVPENILKRFERCSRIYEKYCTVTQSIKQGIDIQTSITWNQSKL